VAINVRLAKVLVLMIFVFASPVESILTQIRTQSVRFHSEPIRFDLQSKSFEFESALLEM